MPVCCHYHWDWPLGAGVVCKKKKLEHYKMQAVLEQIVFDLSGMKKCTAKCIVIVFGVVV